MVNVFYISGKESTNDIVTMIAFGRSWFANVFDSSDVHLPCTLLELFCDYSEQVGELIIYDIDERRLSSSEFTVKYDAESHSFIPISGGFSFVNERVQIKFDEVTWYIKSDDGIDFIDLGIRELKEVPEKGETRQVLEKLFQLSNTVIVDEKTGTINFTFNNLAKLAKRIYVENDSIYISVSYNFNNSFDNEGYVAPPCRYRTSCMDYISRSAGRTSCRYDGCGFRDI